MIPKWVLIVLKMGSSKLEMRDPIGAALFSATRDFQFPLNS